MGEKPERLSQVLGATVTGQQGENLGQITDFVIHPASGRIQFAVISLSDPAQAGKLTAVPWQLVRPGTSPNTFMLNADKQKLSTAPTFDATSWPDFSQPTWMQQLYSHYGVQPHRMGLGERGQPGSEGGAGSSGGAGTSGGAGSSPDQGASPTPGSPK